MRYDFDIAADLNPGHIPEWARNPIRYNFEEINHIWYLSQWRGRWWLEADGWRNHVFCQPQAVAPALTTPPILLTAVAPAIQEAFADADAAIAAMLSRPLPGRKRLTYRHRRSSRPLPHMPHRFGQLTRLAT